MTLYLFNTFLTLQVNSPIYTVLIDCLCGKKLGLKFNESQEVFVSNLRLDKKSGEYFCKYCFKSKAGSPLKSIWKVDYTPMLFSAWYIDRLAGVAAFLKGLGFKTVIADG